MLFSDTFNRADGVLTTPWVTQGNACSIGTNAVGPSATSNAFYVSTVDVGKTDVDVSCRLSVVTNVNGLNQGVVARCADSSNYIRFAADRNNSLFHLQKNVAGTFTALGASPFSQTPAVGDVLRLVCVGNGIYGYVNGVLVLSAVDGAGATNTKVGVCSNVGATADGTNRLDDFICCSATPVVGSSLRNQIMLDSPYLYWRGTTSSGTTEADHSGNGRTGTINGSPALVSRLVGGLKCMDYDATNDYIIGPNAPSSTAGTLEALMYLDTYQASSPNIRNIFGWGVSGNNLELRVGNSGASSNLELVAQKSGPVVAVASASGASPLTVVCHVMGTWDGSNLNLYKNGVLIAGPTAFTGTISGGIAFYAGVDQTLARWFDGALCELAFYTTALSSARVAAHAAAALEMGVVLG